MDRRVSMKDIEALEVYLLLLREPDAYDMQQDLFCLMHWQYLTSDGFALRLRKEYPQLTLQELNLCCLLRMGYSWKKIGELMKVKDGTARRYIYRVCSRLDIPGNKKDFERFIKTY